MTILQAARKAIAKHRRPLDAGEIADDLLAGNFKTKAKNFRTTIYSILLRAEGFTSDKGKWSYEDSEEGSS